MKLSRCERTALTSIFRNQTCRKTSMAVAETQEAKEARWKREDENTRVGMRSGNPLASLCFHCYGRHWAPTGDECPRPKYERESK